MSNFTISGLSIVIALAVAVIVVEKTQAHDSASDGDQPTVTRVPRTALHDVIPLRGFRSGTIY